MGGLELCVVGRYSWIYQVIEDVTEKFRNKLWKAMNVKTDCFSWKFLQMAVTFVLVVFAWIFF